MGLLFGSKAEKALGKCKKKELPLDVRYVDGHAGHKTQLIRFDRQKLIMTGFAETLREDSLEVVIRELNISFRTRVTHTSHDIKGQILYHCPLPEDHEIAEIRKREERFFIYPRGIAALAPENEKVDTMLITTNNEETLKTMKFYIWNVTGGGLELVNSVGYRINQGLRFAGKVKVGSVEVMVGLEVIDLAVKPFRKEAVSIVSCKYTSPPDKLGCLLEICKKVDNL